MKQSIINIALVIRDYDEAIEFYTQKLNFVLVEDSYQPEQDKRWVVVAPSGSDGVNLVLAKASNKQQEAAIGNQTGGRVFLFLRTDDFWRDYRAMQAAGGQVCTRAGRAAVWDGGGVCGFVRQSLGFIGVTVHPFYPPPV